MREETYFRSPIGILKITIEEEALVGLNLIQEEFFDLSLKKCPVAVEVERQLVEFFSGKRKEFQLPIHFKGTSFQQKVWNALMKIPYGETKSYQEIAIEIENPKAVRAVGMANHQNPVMIVVPCHRVIGKNGTLTGYAGGIEVKQYLLELEKNFCTK